MRQAMVFYDDIPAGIITENDEGYVFAYDKNYLASPVAQPVSLTLPLQEQAYQSKILFPFFDGLIPEGWLLNIGVNNWKINPKDRFGLLLSMCRDCIGCVSVLPKENEL